MYKQQTLTLRLLSVAVIAALLVSGCSGSLSLDGGVDLGGDDGDGSDGGANISENQLLVVLMIVLLVVALVGILR